MKVEVKELIEWSIKAYQILEDLQNNGAVDFSEDDNEVIENLELAIINARQSE